MKNRTHSTIYWDIVGHCNARCKYCYTGNQTHPSGGNIDVSTFSQAMAILAHHKLVDSKCKFNLYTWGEPTLHPELGEIFNILKTYGNHYAISTNCGHRVNFQDSWFDNLDRVIISMCGFSQSSYDKIHKLNFEVVKDNILHLINTAISAGYDTNKICVAHHIYQFNIHEIPSLYKFCKEHNIDYHPYYAVLGNLKQTDRFIRGELSTEEWKEISTDIIGNSILERARQHPQSGCKQFNRLVIDEKCNILTCCCLPKNHSSYKITNIFDADFIEVLSTWSPDENCKECIQKRLSQYDEQGAGNFNLNEWQINDLL